MISLATIIHQLTGNAEVMRVLVQTLSDEQMQWKPTSESWSMKNVMEHVYNEERIDFRLHLKEMLDVPPRSWGSSTDAEYVSVENCRQALAGFLSEREASIAYLQELVSPDWDIKCQVPFGPLPEIITLCAGDVLVSWVEHDFLHIRQIIELLHAWHERSATPYAVQYAGGW